MLESMPPKLEERYGPQLAIVRRFALGSAKHGAPARRVATAVEHALTASRPRTRYVVGHDAKTRLLLERLLPTRLRDRLILERLR